MKTHLAVAAAVLSIPFALLAAPAQAAIEYAAVGDTVHLYDGPGDRGGVFYVDVTGKASSPLINGYDFPTFCVEIGEYITLGAGNAYYVDDISSVTVNTGSTLGSFAAWLYTSYIQAVVSPGTGLSALAHWGTTNVDMNAVQRGIWLSMGYTNADSSIVGGYDTDLFNEMFAAYKASAWASSTANANPWNYGFYTGQVAIMNLTAGDHSGGGNVQDQLVIQPQLPPPVGTGPMPEPMSFFVWSLLAMCVGSAGLRRRA